MSKRQTRVSTSLTCEIHETALRCAVSRNEPLARYIERALLVAFKADGVEVVDRKDAVQALLIRKANRRVEREHALGPHSDPRDFFT